MTIALRIEHGPFAGIAHREILRRIRAMVALLQLKKNDISFLLTNDKRIHELNKIYRGKDRPTDVLAFAMREGEFAALAGEVLGDVIVSVPTAEKQAASHGVATVDEVTMLLAHGLLHLLGWDHETTAKDRRMRAETARLVAAAGPGGRSKGGAGKALSRKGSPSTTRGRRSKP